MQGAGDRGGGLTNWRDDLRDSTADFTNIVWPAIKDSIGGGMIVPTEGTPVQMFNAVDMLSGIDILQRLPSGAQRALASRVQWGDRAWRTFTIRSIRTSNAETELEKRLRTFLDESGLLPTKTIQAYLTERGGRLICAGVVDTKPLLKFVVQHLEQLVRQARLTENAMFIWVPWDELRCADIEVLETPSMANASYIMQYADVTGLRYLARHGNQLAQNELNRRGTS